jgi:hypothetical protein
MIGLLEGIANFTAGLSKGYFGKWSDSTGLRLPFVKIGYLLSTVSKPMLGMPTRNGGFSQKQGYSVLTEAWTLPAPCRDRWRAGNISNW